MFYILNEKEIPIEGNFSLYFYAPWMLQHKKMLIMINKIEEKFNTKFYAVNSDLFKGYCLACNVKSIPTVILFNGLKEIKRIEGVVMTSAFKTVYQDFFKNDILKTGE